MKHILKGKNILLFAPAFFGYEHKIKEKMIEMGASVDFFDERSITKNWQKALLKVNPNIFKRRTEKYYFSILENKKNNKYDYIFFIKCEMVPIEILKEMKVVFQNSQFVLYLYDSLSNIKNINQKLKYFNRICSFDRIDCINNKNFIFRPLFYCDEYMIFFKEKKEYKYDLCFIGTIHSDRYKVLKEIKNMAKTEGLSIYIFPYIQSKLIYHFYKFIKKEFRDTQLSDFVYEKKSINSIAKIVDESRIIIDIQHEKQTGLTMRTIEMIGMHKQIITTNKDIVNYDFYNNKNISIFDRKNSNIDISGLAQSYKKLDKTIYEKYSLYNWIIDVLGGDFNE